MIGELLLTPAIAVAAERLAIEEEARRYAGMYSPHSDGRNTFVIFADYVWSGRGRTPLPVELQPADYEYYVRTGVCRKC